MRAIFFGTPQLSADILNYLLDQPTITIVAIISNPDTTGGRGHRELSSPVSRLARERGIPLFQPEKIRKNEDFFENIRSLNPDIGIVVAYGKILPQTILAIPPLGLLNVHTSLLPKYRGAAPIQHALLNGETTTGLTVQQMALAMDEGDIVVQETWDISDSDTTGSLFEKTGSRGGPLLMQAIVALQDQSILPMAQDHTQATYTHYIQKTDAEIRPEWTVNQAYNAWQAYTPWPGLYTTWGETKITLHRVEKYTSHTRTEQWSVIRDLPAIPLSDGYLLINELTPAGKKRMTGEAFVRGYLMECVF